jgi:hypothetical protein
MAGLPSLQVGNALAVDRQALVERLENIAAGEPFQQEVSRRARVAETLATLRPGELRIQFAGGRGSRCKGTPRPGRCASPPRQTRSFAMA